MAETSPLSVLSLIMSKEEFEAAVKYVQEGMLATVSMPLFMVRTILKPNRAPFSTSDQAPPSRTSPMSLSSAFMVSLSRPPLDLAMNLLPAA